MRNKRLDVLRCIAILLVLFYHGGVVEYLARGGWMGVDLFFVLSGFLISGLMFSEYRKNGSIQFKRFFIRRGFKIYPAFYSFVAFIALIELYRHHFSSFSKYLHEIFFVQSYWLGIWVYTWSLAVEEHFYIFLPLLLLLLLRFSPNRQNPFRAIPAIFLVVAVLCMASRAVSAFAVPADFNRAYYASHNRMDSLFFGVLLGYLHHFYYDSVERYMNFRWVRYLLTAFSIGFLPCAVLFSRESRFFATIGYTLIYIGSGALLLLSLHVHDVLPKTLAAILKPLGTCFARIGVYSYSIYLWQGAVTAYLLGLTLKIVHLAPGRYGIFTLFVVETLAVGIFMSKLVEYPVLHLRNRFFPSPISSSSNIAESVDIRQEGVPRPV
jgi:peptidoglycan/LPS O-acetylase OafA/YrhL